MMQPYACSSAKFWHLCLNRLCCAFAAMPNRWSRDRPKGEISTAPSAAKDAAKEEAVVPPASEANSSGPVSGYGNLTLQALQAKPHGMVFTLGQTLVETHMLDLFASHGVGSLLDLRPRSIARSAAWSRRDLARICAAAGVELERPKGGPEGIVEAQPLLAALRFSKPPAALLFAESDPRNAWRRALSEEVLRAGWQVLHVTTKLAKLMIAPHQDQLWH